MISKLISLLSNDCPNCAKGKIFKVKNIFFSFGFSEMNSHCEVCNFKFEKEPGFFMGAMYASYGLSIFEIFLTYFVASRFFEETFDLRILAIIMVVVLLLSFFNYRLSRILWIHLFMKKRPA